MEYIFGFGDGFEEVGFTILISVSTDTKVNLVLIGILFESVGNT